MENGDLPPKLPGGKLISDSERVDPEASRLISNLIQEGINIDPRIAMMFEDKFLFSALIAAGKTNDDLKDIIINSSAFSDLKYDQSIFLEPITIDSPLSLHEDGTRRRKETGNKINLKYIQEKGIDATKVIFFRVTQPSETPKPEYFWTTDFFETIRGLREEIPDQKRQTSIILAADMLTISGTQGLMTDINDDQGLSVRQIGLEPFDQSRAIAVIPTSALKS